MVRILVTDGIEASAAEKLRDAGFELIEKFYEQEELGEALKDYDVLVVRSATKVRIPSLDKAAKTGKLKLIIRAGVGIDNIDVDYALTNNIRVVNTPNASAASVAELTIAHMFAIARFLQQSNVSMREGKWEKKEYQGVELKGKIMGLIGMGRIAREVAQRAKALGMQVIYTDLPEKEHDQEYEYNDLNSLLTRSDFVSLHCPFCEGQEALIGKNEIAQMKKGSFIINCARGGLVDEQALMEALDSGHLAGACIDVFEEEPTHNQELINHPQLSVTPHIGAATYEAQRRIGEEVADIIIGSFQA